MNNAGLHGWLVLICGAIVPLMVVVGLGLLVEKIRPVTELQMRGVVFNLNYSVVSRLFQAAVSPAISGMFISLVNGAGGSLLVLPARGWGLVAAVAAYTIVMDFGEFIFHRAQHRFPVLWAMHSLHHSDPAVNVSTTERHYWAEQVLKAGSIYLAVALLFKTNPLVIHWYGLISLSNAFFHMNLRVSFGRCALLLNSPQYHRIHHSRLPEHRDRNFAALFPIFDILTGSYYAARRDEYPPTGLYDQDKPSGVMESLVWPLHSWIRDYRGERLLASSD
jgi:sterol desaturase/sphingolipid hydroxylase (fatty acid hydroxylase superfamily)